MKNWSEICRQKIVEPDAICAHVSKARTDCQTIATVNGTFDILHVGHLYFLFEAAGRADQLIVLLNSDQSVKTYKSQNRPIVPLKERCQVMAALACIDYVTWFDEADPRKILKEISPDVHVNGLEYGKNCIEAETVERFGGKIHLIDRLPPYSTSAIVEAIQKHENL